MWSSMMRSEGYCSVFVLKKMFLSNNIIVQFNIQIFIKSEYKKKRLDGEGGNRHVLLKRSNFFDICFYTNFFPLSWLGLVVGIIVCICKKRGWAGCKNFIVTRYWAKNLLFSAHGMREIFSKYFVKNQ